MVLELHCVCFSLAPLPSLWSQEFAVMKQVLISMRSGQGDEAGDRPTGPGDRRPKHHIGAEEVAEGPARPKPTVFVSV